MEDSFCTSSINKGQGLFKKKSLGSSLACTLVKRSSKLLRLNSGNSRFTSVDFPTCLAPTINVHLLFFTLLFKISEIALGIYAMPILRLI